ncbi:glycosyltransferase family 4 protein, partial [Staphylococcus sp. 231237_7MaSpsaltlick]
MKNKILFIYNIPSPYRVEFLNELNKNIDFKVVFEKETASHRNEKWLAKHKLKNNNNYFINKSMLKFIRLLYDICKSNTVVLGGYSTKKSMLLIFFMKFINKKFILNADGGFIKEESKFKYRLKKHLIKSAEYWLSTGIKTSEYLKYYGANEENIFIYPFTSIYMNEVSLDKNFKSKDEMTVLFVGSFNKEKGINKLIKAATYLKNIDFIFIGGKPSSYQQNLSEKKTNITFINHIEKLELSNYYKTADLFVFPTYSDVWGLVINEAMAKGLPIITTDKCIAGIEMIVSEEIGKIIPVNTSAEQLAEHINYAICNYEKFNTTKIINIAQEYT